MLLPRRKVLALGGFSTLAASPVLAATPFTTFAFQATGEPASRTMPDRLADIKNVLDFGADLTDGSDSTAAIQAAINWTSGANRGTIFFPTGSYKITSPLTLNYSGALSIRLKGEGNGTFLDGHFGSTAGFIFDRALVSPSNQAQIVIENFTFSNNSTAAVAGSIRVGSSNSVAIRDCQLGGNIGITTEDSPGNSSQNILIEDCRFPTGTGLIMGGPGAVLGCDFVGCNVGAQMYGNGWIMSGNRIERSNTAYLLGVDSASTDQGATGFAIMGSSMEGNWTGIDFSGTCSGFYLGSLGCLTHNASSENSGAGALTISSYTYNSGTGLVTLTMSATIPEVLITGIPLFVQGLNIGALNGTFNSVSASGTTVTYTGPTGQAGSPSLGGTLWLGGQYAIRIRANKAANGLFSGVVAQSDSFDTAALSLGTSTNRANLLFVSCIFNKNTSTTGVNFSAPSNAFTGWFQNCNIAPIWTFSQLPSGGNVFEGDEFSISDSTTNTWGATASGTGSDHVLVRYNGSNWTVVAK